MIRIIGVGDIMPGGLLNASNEPCANDEVKHFLDQGDIRCGTLECALGNNPTYDDAKVADRGNVIYAKDDDIRRLNELRIDVVSLANNHFFDLGLGGAIHTIELLDREGISHCGAGRNLKEAGKPVVKRVDGKSIAFLAFCDTDYNNVYYCTYATENAPGVNPMIAEYVECEIKKAANIYDYVVILAHWGTEYTYYPNLSTVKMADLMIKSGANLILGSHPHCVQPIVNTHRKIVVYSMGNFLFPDRLIAPPKVTYYPEIPLDYTSIPVTDKYPIVSEVTLKILPFIARVGMAILIMIEGNSIKVSYKLTFLNGNVLEFLDEERSQDIIKIIERIGNPLKHNCYKAYLYLFRIKSKISSIIKRFLNED